MCKMLKVAHIQSFSSFCAKLTYLKPKGFCLVPAGLKWALWAEKRKLALWHFKSKKQNNTINRCQSHFLTSDEVPSKKYFFRLSLADIGPNHLLRQLYIITDYSTMCCERGRRRRFYFLNLYGATTRYALETVNFYYSVC